MHEQLVSHAGSIPAAARSGRWRQVALLATAAALSPDLRIRADLAGVLHGLDLPDAAAVVAATAVGDPWAQWWEVLAAGQSGEVQGYELPHLEAQVGSGPDAREVARRREDLAIELHDIHHGTGEGRFALLGVTHDAPRRALLVGRSSAVFLVEPAWDELALVRLGPSDGPAGGNRAHLTLEDVMTQIARGERGAERPVPADLPDQFVALAMLESLREDRGVRDQRLLRLADEVRDEREQLAEDRVRLRTEKSQVAAILRQVAAMRAQPIPGETPLPTTLQDAASLLEIGPDASPTEIERAFRAQIVRCHPDRVADLHPRIRGQAEGMTVALNAARELMMGGKSTTRHRTPPN